MGVRGVGQAKEGLVGSIRAHLGICDLSPFGMARSQCLAMRETRLG